MSLSLLWLKDLPLSDEVSWDILKLIVQSQYNLAANGIVIIACVAVLLAGASWVANFQLTRRRLDAAIRALQSRIAEDTEKALAELAGSIGTQVEKRTAEIGKDLRTPMLLANTENSRLFALYCWDHRDWGPSAAYWARTIPGYAIIGEDALLRVATDSLNDALGRCTALRDIDKEQIERAIPSIPSILQRERDQIQHQLNALPPEKKDISD